MGNLNDYGLGTVMHEILHKQAVAGGFSHPEMDEAIAAVGRPPLALGHNNESEMFAKCALVISNNGDFNWRFS